MNVKLRKIVIRMSKLTIYSWVFCQSLLMVMASESNAQRKYLREIKVELSFDNSTVGLRELINSIEQSSQFHFAYSRGDVRNKQLEINSGIWDLRSLMDEISVQGRFSIKRINETITLMKVVDEDLPQVREQKIAQNNISGTVSDENGESLPGASIVEVGTSNGTITDVNGNFSMEVSDDAVLSISFVGYRQLEIPVDNQEVFEIIMEPDIESLQEVVVVGFDVQESRKVVSSVSQVTAEELQVDERPVTSIQSALVGSIPGLNGLNPNGRPGTTPNLSIRGASTLNNAGLLVIIDGFEGSLNDIDPRTVESVSVLKDAAAVAIYGARGANGVLLITTRQTKRNEQLSVSYNFSLSQQSPRDLPTTLTSLELMEFENYAVTGDPTGGGDPGAPYSPSAMDLARSGFYPETIWPEELYNKNAGQQSHNLTVQGGGQRAGYLINASYLNQDGLVLGADNFQRINLRLKVDADVTDWLTVGTNTLISNRITNETPANGGNGLLGSPFFPVKSADGLWVYKGSPGEANPIAQAASGSFTKQNRDAVNAQAYIQIRPIKGLRIEERVSILKDNINTRDWFNVYDHVALDLTDPDSYTNPNSPNRIYSVGSPDSRRLNLTSMTGYSLKTLTKINYDLNVDDHHIGVLLGFQSEQGESESFAAGRTGFILDNLIDMSLGQTANPAIGGGLGNNSSRGGNATTLSYFGRINYDFRGRYLAEFSFRRDGSSYFLENNQWAFFPAVAVGWNIAEEAFLSGTDFLDQLKLRASYGKAGDDSGVGPRSQQLATIDVSGYPIGGSIQPRILLGAPANPDLKWETSTTFNTGLDFILWQGLVQANVEYFVTHREDILAEVATPVEFGFGDVPGNAYAVRSWGWELKLTHENTVGPVKYWISGNLTNYDNEITDLAGIEMPDFAVGQSINDWFGYETDGFFNSQEEIDSYIGEDGVTPIDQSNVGGSFIGGYKYIDQLTVDTNGDGVPDEADGIIDGDDRVILQENSDTNMNLGINLGVTWNGFTLSSRFYGALNRNQWWSGAAAHEPFLNGTNAFTYQSNYWSVDNPDAYFPVPRGNGIQGYASDVSHLIFDNEFIKLQNVTLAYSFNNNLLSGLRFVNGLDLMLSVENLGVMWTNNPIFDSGWDPELGAGNVDYPLPVTTSFGLNVKF